MQGVLKSFEPKLINGQHYSYKNKHDEKKPLYVFVVKLESNLKEIMGEAASVNMDGSRSWEIGKNHEFEARENDRAEGGYNISKLKCLEQANSPGGQGSAFAFDIKKESYVISRFAHTFALERLLSMNEEDRKKLETDHGQEVVSKMAMSVAKSVENVALEVQKLHEGGNREAS